MAQEHTIIKVEDVSKIYHMGEETCTAVDHVSFQVTAGEQVAIVGKSGSGKTTLLNIIGTMDCPTSGNVYVDNQNITGLKSGLRTKYRRTHIGFVFQFFHLLPMLTLEENIMLPLSINHQKMNQAYVQELVELLGVQDKLKYYPNQLSGGQQQRGAIARALVHKPELLLADEPTGNLDEHSTKDVMELMAIIKERYHTTILMVTHDPAIAAQADRRIQISDGRILSIT